MELSRKIRSILMTGVAALTLSSPGAALSQTTSIDPGASEKVDAHGTCHQLTNNNNAKIMVPHKFAAEWVSEGGSFLERTPSGVAVSACGFATSTAVIDCTVDIVTNFGDWGLLSFAEECRTKKGLFFLNNNGIQTNTLQNLNAYEQSITYWMSTSRNATHYTSFTLTVPRTGSQSNAQACNAHLSNYNTAQNSIRGAGFSDCVRNINIPWQAADAGLITIQSPVAVDLCTTRNMNQARFATGTGMIGSGAVVHSRGFLHTCQ